MNQIEFDAVVKETMASLENLLLVKGGEYAGSEDRLGNFKRGANLTGVKPLTVLFIYLSKHYDAVSTYVRDMQTGGDRPRSESIDGRLDDLINYCLLAKAIIREGGEQPKKSRDGYWFTCPHCTYPNHSSTPQYKGTYLLCGQCSTNFEVSDASRR